MSTTSRTRRRAAKRTVLRSRSPSGIRPAKQGASALAASVSDYLASQPPTPTQGAAGDGATDALTDSWVSDLLRLTTEHDVFVGAHQERVEGYVRVMARWVVETRPMSLASYARDAELIARGARLHDVGTVCVPRTALYRGGPLTPEEQKQVRGHCRAGADSIEPLLSAHPDDALVRIAREIALGHHERYDGSGYPLRLSAEEIPVHVELAAVADTFDELTCGRQIDERLSFEAATRAIVSSVGADFGPVAVSAFSATQAQLEALHSQYLNSLDVVELEPADEPGRELADSAR